MPGPRKSARTSGKPTSGKPASGKPASDKPATRISTRAKPKPKATRVTRVTKAANAAKRRGAAAVTKRRLKLIVTEAHPVEAESQATRADDEASADPSSDLETLASYPDPPAEEADLQKDAEPERPEPCHPLIFLTYNTFIEKDLIHTESDALRLNDIAFEPYFHKMHQQTLVINLQAAYKQRTGPLAKKGVIYSHIEGTVNGSTRGYKLQPKLSNLDEFLNWEKLCRIMKMAYEIQKIQTFDVSINTYFTLPLPKLEVPRLESVDRDLQVIQAARTSTVKEDTQPIELDSDYSDLQPQGYIPAAKSRKEKKDESKSSTGKGRVTATTLRREEAQKRRDNAPPTGQILEHLHDKWFCHDVKCHNYQKGCCWKDMDESHVPILSTDLGCWAEDVDKGQTTVANPSRRLLQRWRVNIGKARKNQATGSPAAAAVIPQTPPPPYGPIIFQQPQPLLPAPAPV